MDRDMCKSADITERQQDLICFLNKKYNSTHELVLPNKQKKINPQYDQAFWSKRFARSPEKQVQNSDFKSFYRTRTWFLY